MKQAILSVVIDEKNNVEVRMQGEPSFSVPMLWALDIAKNWLVKKATEGNTATSEWQTAEELAEKEVSRSDAIGVYLDARTKIENRLQAIVKSDETQTFRINADLLSNL